MLNLMTVCRDMVAQANMLIARLQADPKVDFANDWKVVTLFIGGNDLCESCMNPVRLILHFVAWLSNL